MNKMMTFCLLSSMVLAPAAFAGQYCHVNLASADNSVVAGQTDLTINFQVFRYRDHYYATNVQLEAKNLNIPSSDSVKIHWINGRMDNGQFTDAKTAQVVSLNYDASRATFVGELLNTNTDLGQQILDAATDYSVGTSYPNQIAVQIGANGWLDDAMAHAGRHNFNFDLGKAFIAQGGEDAGCFVGYARF